MVWKIRGNGALGKAFGRVRLLRGSTEECTASSGSAIVSAKDGRRGFMRVQALEVELAKARAIAYWDDARRRIL